MYDLDVLLGAMPKRKPNGQFCKGHVPANKGKKWDEWLPKEMQEKARANLYHKGRAEIGGWNKKAIAALKDNRVVFFESSKEAERRTGINARNIRHACNKERKFAGGCRWFFADDEELKLYLHA